MIMTFEDYVILMIKILNGIKSQNSDDLVTVVEFVDCYSSNMNGKNEAPGPGLFEILVQHNYYITQISGISMIRCNVNILKSTLRAHSFYFRHNLVVSIQNTSFSTLRNAFAVIWLEGTQLFLEGPVAFTKINRNTCS